MNTIAATAVTLLKAEQPEFKEYAKQIMLNCKALAKSLMDQGCKLVTNGTDNHMLVLNTVQTFGLDGKKSEEILDQILITTNKQIIPDDPNPPLKPSGIRMGTPAATTRGMKEQDMRTLAGWIVSALKNSGDAELLSGIKSEVKAFCKNFPPPGTY